MQRIFSNPFPQTRRALKRTTAALAIVLSGGLIARAQTTSPYVPNVLPSSPTASSLAKFSDVPVSYYTGAADVTVPIYTVPAHGVSVPITLSYHTGGLKVKEEAGPVGLGWALSNGGMISRQIKGKDDFTGNYFNTSIPQLINPQISPQNPTYHHYGTYNFGTYGYDFFCNYLVQANGGTVDFSPAYPGGASSFDMEADVFNFNFPGKSGKFIITRAGTVLLQEQDNLDIKYESNGNSFTIRDEQGNQYYFSDKEYTLNPSGVGQSVSSWYITRIITQVKDTVKFTYNTDGTYTYTPGDIYQTNRVTSTCNAGISGNSPTTNQYLNMTLQTIDFAGGQVQYSFDNSREDLQGARKINSIKVYSKDASGNLQFFKESKLYYSYFGYTSGYNYERLRLDSVKDVSGTTEQAPYVFIYNAASVAKNSNSVDHWGYYNGAGNSSYIPTFFDQVTQASTVDYLYIDGANREPDSTNMQAFALTQVQYPTGGKTAFEYEPNEYDFDKSQDGQARDYVTQPIFTQIVNLGISKRGDTSNTLDLTKLYGISTSGVFANATVSVTFRNKNNNDPNASPVTGNYRYKGTNGKLYFSIFGTTFDISNSNIPCPTNLPFCGGNTVNFILRNATNYTWAAHIDADTNVIHTDFQDITVMITWHELTRVHNNSPTLRAGGLRLKSVSEKDINNKTIKKRRFDYGYMEDKLGTGTPQQYTYGRLMSFPSYARMEIMNDGSCAPGLAIFGSSNTSLTSVIKGNIVGYDQVAEYNIDTATGNDIGKTVYYYFNGVDTTAYFNNYRLPGIQNIGNSLYGSLVKKEVYANNSGTYQLVAKSENFYHTVNRNICFDFKGSAVATTSGSSQDCPNGTCVPVEIFGAFSPALKSERILLDSTKETTYDQVTANTMTVTKYFNYDNPLHYQPTRSSVLDSKGNKHVSYIKYPQDYIPTGNTVTGNTILDTIINKNMVATAIEKSDSLYYAGSTTGYITGAQYSSFKIVSSKNVLLPDKVFKLAVNSPVTNFQPMAISGNTVTQDSRYAQMVSMDSYDGNYNIAQYTAADQIPVSIIWDYHGVYPVAQVKHSPIGWTAYTSFESDGGGGWTIASATRDASAAITGRQSYNLSNGTASVGNLNQDTFYVVSYWSKTGAAYTLTGNTSLHSFTTKQGKTINGWTYFEHSFNGVTSVTVSGTNDIDELRIFPSSAQMTTFAYDPLLGMTAQSDVNNRITYYSYDALGRLVTVRDQDLNVVKKICYDYLNRPVACAEIQSPSTCGGTGNKFVSGACETGQTIYTSSVFTGEGSWLCTYHYLWSDGSVSQDFTKTSTTSCPVDGGGQSN